MRNSILGKNDSIAIVLVFHGASISVQVRRFKVLLLLRIAPLLPASEQREKDTNRPGGYEGLEGETYER